MDSKTLSVLEYPKVLARWPGFCDFSASMQLARELQPTTSLDLALARLAETAEARRLLSIHDLSIGGSHDIRAAADLAARGGVLDPQALLDIKSTLIACRDLKKSLEKTTSEYPRIWRGIAVGLPEAARHRGCHHARALRARRGAGLGLRRSWPTCAASCSVAHDRLMSACSAT